MDRLLERLIETRKRVELTQEGMARALGMSLRAYQAIEGQESKCRLIHVLAAERVALRMAVERGNPTWLPGELMDDVLSISKELALG